LAIRGSLCMQRAAAPAWLWSIDGSRVLLGQPGRRGDCSAPPTGPQLAKKDLRPGPTPHRRAGRASFAGRLPPAGAIRMERLRGVRRGRRAGLMTLRLRGLLAFSRRQPWHPDRGRWRVQARRCR